MHVRKDVTLVTLPFFRKNLAGPGRADGLQFHRTWGTAAPISAVVRGAVLHQSLSTCTTMADQPRAPFPESERDKMQEEGREQQQQAVPERKYEAACALCRDKAKVDVNDIDVITGVMKASHMKLVCAKCLAQARGQCMNCGRYHSDYAKCAVCDKQGANLDETWNYYINGYYDEPHGSDSDDEDGHDFDPRCD